MLSRFPYLTGLMLGGALAATAPVRAADAPASNEVVVSRGSAVLTLTDVDARVSKIPLTKRAGFMNSPERIEDTLEKMLIVRQMAEEARGLGMESDPVVQAEVKLAADQALARRWLEKRIAEIKVPDLSAAAKERYLGNKQAYATPETISVRHLLIRTSAHGEEQAIKLATELRAQFLAEGGEFGDFVAAHSEEPAAGDKKGLIEDLVSPRTRKNRPLATRRA